tara:strand:+ start:4031 stop:4483 length:453 start_codon:yes stop_codon:yes gene_type:complete
MTKLRHIGITVRDAEQSLKLYRDYFKFEVVWDQMEEGDFIDSLSGIKNIKVRTVKLKSQEGMIELLQYFSHPATEHNKDKITRVGCSHFALTVDDLDKTHEDLTNLGLNFLDSPKKSPDNNAKVCFCRDFDGALIELVEEIKYRPRSNNV